MQNVVQDFVFLKLRIGFVSWNKSQLYIPKIITFKFKHWKISINLQYIYK